MDSLQVRTGVVSLKILDDAGEERGIFKFNPTDIESAKKVVELQGELEERQKDFETRATTCETTEQKINLLEESVSYFEELVDKCFGEGSSKLLFGDAKTLSMFDDFFNGIIPYYKKASEQRMEKYKLNKEISGS